MKRWLIAALIGWLLPVAAGAATSGPIAEGSGVIRELDFARHGVLIGGTRYEVAIDAKVEIGGRFGAFTMLEPGMRVYFEFERHSETTRVIRLIRELPKDVLLEES